MVSVDNEHGIHYTNSDVLSAIFKDLKNLQTLHVEINLVIKIT